MLSFAFFGVSHVAANSLPGDPLYQVKYLEQQIALAQTHNQEEQVSLQMAHLSTALADLSTVVKERRSDADITAALAVVASDTQQSQHAVNIFPVGQSRENLVKALTGMLDDERAVLLHLLPQLGWSQQLAFTNQVGHVGGQIHSCDAGNDSPEYKPYAHPDHYGEKLCAGSSPDHCTNTAWDRYPTDFYYSKGCGQRNRPAC